MNHCLYPPGVNFTSDAASQDLVEKHPIHRQYFNEVIDVSRTYVILSENSSQQQLPPANSKPRDPSINSGLTNNLPEYPTIDLSNHVNIGLLDHDNCGKSEENYLSRKKRLTSGKETLIYEFPWMVLIQREYRKTVIQSGHQNLCGGALINENYVLTAAHCVVSKQYTLKVNIGEHDWTKSCDYNCSIENKIFEIEKIRVHPNYQSENICMYDIALIRLKGTVNMKQPNVKPICLPLEPAKHSTYDTKFIATGWGETEDSLSSVYLRKVVLPIVNNKRCSSMPKYENITSRHICAGDGRKKSICHMDSGGPLQTMSHYHNSLRYVLYGIAVCAPPCDDSNGNRPSVFTNVSFYVKWILDTITK
ncbi:phenoloxidase-activating factor 3-like [Aphidius gifuensis]|nr:phenoloxidase-activating factor 3-like [Aphidius gifuensis]